MGILHPPFPSADQNSSNRKRNIFDFEKIMNNKFLIWKNEEVGFSIKYPAEVTIYQYKSREIKERYPAIEGLVLAGAVNFSLVSQLAEGTELFDGLSIDVLSYKNFNKVSLEQIVPQETKRSYAEEGGVISRQKVTINSLEGLKIITCCWGGKEPSYYFITKNNEYILKIDIFSVGPDKEKFDLIANKIIQSLEIAK